MKYRAGLSDESALSLIGGSMKTYQKGSIRFYILKNGNKVAMKYSKLYSNREYWYGITWSAVNQFLKEKITCMIFILGYEGVVELPIDELLTYFEHADITKHDNGTIKHYHIRFKFINNEIFLHNKKQSIQIDKYYYYNQDIVAKDLNCKNKEDILKEAMSFKDFNEQYKDCDKKVKSRKESRVQKERIAILEDHRCQVCGFKEVYESKSGEKRWIIDVDHILDKSLGGGETIGNLWVLCPNCHRKKTSGIIRIDLENKCVYERGKRISIRDNHLNW